MSDDAEHAEALLRTGFWGRRAVGVLFVSASTGRIGLTLRSGQVLEPHTYGIVGGAIDADEDPREAAAREVDEELRATIAIQPQHLIPLDQFDAPGFQYLTFLYIVPQEFDVPCLNWENDSFDWFALNALPPNLHPGVATSLAKPKVLGKICRLSPGAGGQPRRRRSRSGWSPEDYERAFGPRRR